jgi:2-oxoglutarate dehydrogenase complex dehydrogenase (E1) component-like enzyme
MCVRQMRPPVGGLLDSENCLGNPGGSLEATRRSFNKDFLLALAADFKKHGAAAIEKLRKQQPAAYVKICALLVPREMKVEYSNAIKGLTDEQLDAMIEHLTASLEAQAHSAKVIEGQAEVVPSLPAPVASKPAS